MAGDPRMETIRELCSFEGRLTGTDAERRAGNALAGKLRALGRRVEIDPTYVHPQVGVIHAAHCAIAFAGSLVAVAEPAIGFALVLFAATSLYLDLNARFYLLRTLFFRRASQNVVSPGGNADAPARLLLVAHYDAARTGALYDPKRIARIKPLANRLGLPHSRLLFWSVAGLLPMVGARMAGADSDWISLLQLPPTLILLVAIFLLVDWQLSDVVPGANDNASGVAVALSLAEQLAQEPTENLDVWIVFTGAEECGTEGMRSLVRSRRRELDPAATFVVAIDTVGAGDVRWSAVEGMTISFPMDRRLLELCSAIAAADEDSDGRFRAAPLRRGFATDALPAAVHRLRATAIMCLEPGAILPRNYHLPSDLPDGVDPGALERAEGFTLELIRALDRDIARSLRPDEAESTPVGG